MKPFCCDLQWFHRSFTRVFPPLCCRERETIREGWGGLMVENEELSLSIQFFQLGCHFISLSLCVFGELLAEVAFLWLAMVSLPSHATFLSRLFCCYERDKCETTGEGWELYSSSLPSVQCLCLGERVVIQGALYVFVALLKFIKMKMTGETLNQCNTLTVLLDNIITLHKIFIFIRKYTLDNTTAEFQSIWERNQSLRMV